MSNIAVKPISKLFKFYRDPEYFQSLTRLAIPIILQQFIMSSLNMVGTVMIGQKGDAAIAAVGLAGQVFFLMNLVLFGVASGSAMVTAQLWGKHDASNLRKVLSLCLWMSLVVSLVFVLLSELFPAQILGIYTRDSQVIAIGSDYLHLFAGSFVFFAITVCYSLILRSTGEVRLPMAVSVGALSLNAVLSYGLIFGKIGLPEMGVRGAALAIVISRILECIVLLAVTYSRKLPAAATLREMLNFDLRFVVKVLKPVLPVIGNELFWALGITTYNAVYARIGTGAIAAMNIVSNVDLMAMVLFMGIGNATAVMVGNCIGAGEEEKAYRYAGWSLVLGAATAILVGGVILLMRNPVLTLYKVSPDVIHDAYHILTILGLLVVVRMGNMIMIVGILRGGGDTRFSLFLDGIIIWILGVPMALLGAFVFHLPVYWVYFMVMSEEVTKWALGLRRYFSRKWIHDLTHLSQVASLE